MLSPGAASIHPPLPGIDLPGIFQVRTVPDAKKIKEWIEGGTTFLAGMSNYSGIQMLKPTRRAVVVGGGFIGLEIGERGGIRVDVHMCTSNADILAVGDAIEVKDFGTDEWSLVALAGPDNRQGRIAADVIAGGESRYCGTRGTAIIGLFGGAVAWTGVSENTLKRLGDTDYEKAYIYPNSHAGYYPGAKMVGLKVLFGNGHA